MLTKEAATATATAAAAAAAAATTTSTTILPSPTMKAVQGKDYGDIDEMLCVKDDVATTPILGKDGGVVTHNRMLLKVLAVALAPGDCRVLSGLTRELQGPSHFPYIPGGDCCGIVIALPSPPSNTSLKKSSSLPFQVGDRVVARFTEKPMGALAEYALVSSLVADKVPDHVSSIDAAALIGASPAIDLVKPVKKDERVLVLGASGGIGAHFCQLLRIQGASYVVGVSRNPQRLLDSPIQCNDAIDYTTTDIFTLEKYQKEPFDTIYDFAGGGYQRLEECIMKNECLIVKSAAQGGRFITTVPPHGATYEIHSVWKALEIFLFPTLWKAMVSRVWTRNILPKYSFSMAIGDERRPASKMMEYIANGSIKAVIEGPFSFTTEGVRHAFRLQESRHAHGKVVIQIVGAESDQFKKCK